MLLMGRDIKVGPIFCQMLSHPLGITLIPGIEVALDKICSTHFRRLLIMKTLQVLKIFGRLYLSKAAFDTGTSLWRVRDSAASGILFKLH
jgi:hypothetical protein